MRTEFDRYADSHHQIDQWDSIQWNVPEEHEATQVDNNHRDRYDDHGGRVYIEAHQHKCNDENGKHRVSHALNCVRPHGQVLFIENIKHRIWEHIDFVYIRFADTRQS